MLDEKLQKRVFDQSIVDQKYIEPLEELINASSQQRKDLAAQPLNFGRIYTLSDLREAFEEVKTFTSDFLDVNVRDPRYSFYSPFNLDTPLSWAVLGYGVIGGLYTIGGIATGNPQMINSGFMFLIWAYVFNKMASGPCYIPNKQKVSLDKKMHEAMLKPVFAHEYTHYLQYIVHDGGNPGTLRPYASFIEGHARGVQRAASQHFMEKYDNPAYLWNIVDMDVGEMKSVYKWLCRKLKREPNQPLMAQAKSSRDMDETIYRYMPFGFKPTPHAIGNSIFIIAEEKHGTDIYKKVMKEDFSFLDY